jgi:hypothetical protein
MTGGSTIMSYRDNDQEWQDEQLGEPPVPLAAAAAPAHAAGYNPDQANIELLTQIRTSPLQGEDAMEHLLELRMAVLGLVALGKPQEALRMLEEHVAATPETSTWAYIEYMQICEKTAQREQFEAMRTRYRLQFGRLAPYWQEPNAHVLGLDGYARASAELATAWGKGTASGRALITAWLIGPVGSRKMLQLPAYHDLFDLYEMADFHGHAADAAPPTSGIATEHQPMSARLLQADVPVVDIAHDDFVPTVSLLDLDYEFSTEVTLEARDVQQAERSTVIVKPGNFSVDFNVAGTQMGSLSMPGALPGLPTLASPPQPPREPGPA